MDRRFFGSLAMTAGMLAILHAQAGAQQQDASAVDKLRRKVESCFTPLSGATEKAVIVATFEPHGAVKNTPKILRKGKGPINDTFAKAAVRAILKCGPYAGLGLEGEITFNFDPPETSPATSFDSKSVTDVLNALTAQP